jgi:hypothetical protein
VTPHRDTERVLSQLAVGEAVGVTRDGWTRFGTVVDLGLDGLTVRWTDGAAATVVVHSAWRPDRVSPADLEVVS